MILYMTGKRSAMDEPEQPTADPISAPSERAFLEGRRVVVSIGLAAGLILLWMGQSIYAFVPRPEQFGVFVLMAVGIIVFFLAGHLAVGNQLPAAVSAVARKAAQFFSISPAQLILLGFSFCFALMTRFAAGDDLLARHWFISVTAWLLSMITAGLGCYPRLSENEDTSPDKVDINGDDGLIVLLLFIAALLLRGVATAQLPAPFSGDEGSTGLHAILFLEDQANNLFTIGWFSFPSLFFALLSGSVALLGQTVEAVRLFSALGGALAVVATYCLGRVMFDRLTAVVAAVFLAASHYHIHMSRVGLNNIWDSFFVAGALAGLWYGWRYNRRPGFVLCGLALGLGQYFYVTMRILPVLFLLWAVCAFCRQRALFRQRLPGLILAAFIAVIIFLPLGTYFLTHPDEFKAPLNRVTVVGDRLEQMAVDGHLSEAEVIIRQMALAALGFTHEPLKLLYNPGSPLLLPGAAALFLLGILWGILKFDLRYWLLFLPLISVVITSGLSQDPPASQRFMLAIPIVTLFMAVPIGQAWRWLQAMWPGYKPVVTGVTAVGVALIVLLDINFYFFDVYDTYVYGGQNTVVATEIGHFLQAQSPAEQDVYFYGFPRMGYFSLATIPYLAPQKNGIDITEPLGAPPVYPLEGDTLFIFLPERLSELEFVRRAFPDGRYQEWIDRGDQLLFAVYQVEHPE